MIDIGEAALTDELRTQLAAFNVGRRKYRIANLWIMANGHIHAIELHK